MQASRQAIRQTVIGLSCEAVAATTATTKVATAQIHPSPHHTRTPTTPTRTHVGHLNFQISGSTVRDDDGDCADLKTVDGNLGTGK